MKKQTATWLISGLAAIGLLNVAAASQDSPRRGHGHGECIHESCQGTGQQTMNRARQGQRRGPQDGKGPGQGLQQGQGSGQSRGQGQGEGQFRQEEGQGQGWHRDGSGARKSE